MRWPLDAWVVTRVHAHGPIDLSLPHPAVDADIPVYASHAGTVKDITSAPNGTALKITGGIMATYYLHLSETYFSTGDQVASGEVIGLMGSTGISTGKHLHYEVRMNGKQIKLGAIMPHKKGI